MAATQKQIDLNELYANRLGWTPKDFLVEQGIGVQHGIDDAVIDAIMLYQTTSGLAADGIAGPKTYTAKLQDQIAALKFAVADQIRNKKTLALTTAGQLAVRVAKLTWMGNVVDLPPAGAPNYAQCRQTIDQLIRTPRGINWSWLPPYKPKAFKWCGTLPAEGWGAAGITATVRQKFFSSNYRLRCWAGYEQYDDTSLGLNKKPATGPYRQIVDLDDFPSSRYSVSDVKFPDGTNVREGDIMLIGPLTESDGVHITMIEAVDHNATSSTWISTIEGNGTGYFPDGTYGHGVIRARRQMLSKPSDSGYVGRYLLRPSLTDLEGWA